MTPLNLSTLVGEILDLDPGQVTDALSRTTHAQWTSLRHLQLITTLEEITSVSFTSREMAEVDSVEQLRALLAAKGVADDQFGA